MAVMQALLQIKADVTGEGQVDKLGRAIKSVGTTAGAVTGSLKGLAAAAGMGGLAGSMGALLPLLSVGGLVGMAKSALDAGDSFFDLAQKTGVSVEALARFKKAASTSGTTIDAVGGALTKLSKNMVASLDTAANAAGESAEKIKDRTKRETDQAVDAVKLNMDRQVDAIKEGERKQLDAVKDSADKKIAALERESDARLDELNRRYRQEQKILDDKYEDEADLQEEAAEGEQRTLERAIEKRYDTQIEAIQEDKNLSKEARKNALEALQAQKGDELDMLRDRFEAEAKARRRALRDREEIEREGIEKRKKAEETALKDGFDRQRELVEKGAEAQKAAISKAADGSAESVKRGAEASIAALKAAMDSSGELSDDLDELGLSGKGASKAFTELRISIKDQAGNLRSTDQVMLEIADRFKEMQDGARKTALAVKLFGKSGYELIPMLNMGGAAISKMKVKMTSAFAEKADEYSDKLKALSGKVSALGMDIMVAALPALDALTSALVAVVDAFNSVDPEIRKFIVLGAGLAIAWGPLTGIFTAVSGALTALAGLRIAATIAGWLPVLLQVGPTIAGWLGIIGPVLTAITGLFTGLLAFLTGTVLPALIAFFSGPVGWTVLAIAAVVAMAIAFREPIMEFLGWIGEAFKWGLQAVYAIAWQLLVQPWINLYNLTLREPVTKMWNWFKEVWTVAVKFWNEKVVAPIKGAWDGLMSGIQSVMQRVANVVSGIWNGIVNSIRGVINGFLGGISYAINGTINSVNNLIAAFNRLPGPDIGLIPNVAVPRFAEGAVVNRPTLAVVGEGGEREYIIPESKMGAAAAAYMGGARGASVLGPSTINVTTGPVLQQQGQTYVTMADLQRAMRATEAGTLARIRTPAGRTALGIR